ncbi:MAG: pirin family protein [Chloroflexota bacterium]
MDKTIRKIREIIEPKMVIEGAGVRLLRSFAPNRENRFDPFLLFDHFAFNDPSETPLVGFPTHPHRGIETVTYMLEGSVRHRDSLGNMGVIAAGDVQWMTSGRGILHEEMPRPSQAGRVDGFQLWVNLPAALKMSQPRYQEIQSARIPLQEMDGVSVRVVAGEYAGVRGPVTEIAARPVYMEVQVLPGARFELNLPSEHTVLVYLFEGSALFAEQEVVSALRMITFEPGERLVVETGLAQPAGLSSAARFMVMAGAPFREPIFPYGPFVMNTMEEIQQTLAELRAGTFIQPV